VWTRANPWRPLGAALEGTFQRCPDMCVHMRTRMFMCVSATCLRVCVFVCAGTCLHVNSSLIRVFVAFSRCGGIGTARKDPRYNPEVLTTLESQLFGSQFRRAVFAEDADNTAVPVLIGVGAASDGYGLTRAEVLASFESAGGAESSTSAGRRRLLQTRGQSRYFAHHFDARTAQIQSRLPSDTEPTPHPPRRDPLLDIINPLSNELSRLARCSCDELCFEYDDCCSDFRQACPGAPIFQQPARSQTFGQSQTSSEFAFNFGREREKNGMSSYRDQAPMASRGAQVAPASTRSTAAGAPSCRDRCGTSNPVYASSAAVYASTDASYQFPDAPASATFTGVRNAVPSTSTSGGPFSVPRDFKEGPTPASEAPADEDLLDRDLGRLLAAFVNTGLSPATTVTSRQWQPQGQAGPPNQAQVWPQGWQSDASLLSDASGSSGPACYCDWSCAVTSDCCADFSVVCNRPQATLRSGEKASPVELSIAQPTLSGGESMALSNSALPQVTLRSIEEVPPAAISESEVSSLLTEDDILPVPVDTSGLLSSSCRGRCDQVSLIDDFACQCDDACELTGDCCADREEVCSEG
jgi:hypothetical protein